MSIETTPTVNFNQLGLAEPILRAIADAGYTTPTPIQVKAIPVVESGDTQKAVHLLALPIGGWYRVYASKAGTNEERLTLRAKIEQLASTNSVVAAEIHRKIE